MKKILLTISLLLMTCGSAFALSMPRWGMTSIDVYIPDSEYTSVIKQAFSTWNSASGNRLRLRFYDTRFASKNAPIKIKILDEQAQYQNVKSKRTETTGYFTNMEEGFINSATILIYKKNKTNNENLPKDISREMLIEVGYVLGMDRTFGDCSQQDTIVCSGFGGKNKLTEKDKELIFLKYNRTNEDIRNAKSKK